jgi:hypothetical protein
MSLEDLHDVYAYMLEAINQQKGRIDKIYSVPTWIAAARSKT